MLVLTRQGLPIIDRHTCASAEGVLKGAYVLLKEKGDHADIVLMASGSEVQLILAAQEQLAADGIHARVVSMPSWELFQEQPQSYRDAILPTQVKARLAVEAGAPWGGGSGLARPERSSASPGSVPVHQPERFSNITDLRLKMS